MSVSPVDIHIMQRSQDVALQKHNENNKPIVDQNNFQMHFDKETQVKSQGVFRKDNPEKKDSGKYDAKEKGNGMYYSEGHSKRKEKKEDGKVVLKTQHSFDMKI